MDQLLKILQSHSINLVPDFAGNIQRNEDDQFVISKYIKVGDKSVPWAYFGDWKRSFKSVWQGSDSDLSPSELKLFREEIKRQKEEDDRLKLERHKRVAEETRVFLQQECVALGTTPYLTRKRVELAPDARIYVDKHRGVTLIVPMQDFNDTIWNYQSIYPEKTNVRDKLFTPGGRVKGLFFKFGHIVGEKPHIFICEGYATAASVKLAVSAEAVVLAAFNAGNLEPVAVACRQHYPEAVITICADNDQFNGTVNNTGLNEAWKAARRVKGLVVCPTFETLSLEKRPTDFNDLHNLVSIDEVKKQLQNIQDVTVVRDAVQALEVLEASLDELSPVKSGELKKLEQKQAVDILRNQYKDNLVKEFGDLFLFVGTHWKILEEKDTDKIKQQLQSLHGDKGGFDLVNNTYKLFLIYVPTSPREMFVPRNLTANFKNGTLYAKSKDDGSYALEFGEHKKDDYCVNLLPYDFDVNWANQPYEELNPEFAAMLERVFEGDQDKQEKINCLAQMFGACLMPTFPHLFMLYGPAGTGKSTVLDLAGRLVNEDNLCSVGPQEFNGFNMETMPGKLVNIDTDVETNTPMQDSMLKKIEDQRKVRMKRKQKKDVYAAMPKTHLFGGNKIPKTLEGDSRSHQRRWSFIEFKKVLVSEPGKYNKRFAQMCFDAGPEGILNFAVRGLYSLLEAKGHFINPVSGIETMADWHLESDLVGQFLKDIDQGEVLDENIHVSLHQDGRILRTELFKYFQAWREASGNLNAKRITNTEFYKTLRVKGFKEDRVHDGFAVRGITVFKGPRAKL